jgi:hypothetical protein
MEVHSKMSFQPDEKCHFNLAVGSTIEFGKQIVATSGKENQCMM